MKLVSESGASIAFQHYNKKSWNDFSEIYVYDRKWGEKSFRSDYRYAGHVPDGR